MHVIIKSLWVVGGLLILALAVGTIGLQMQPLPFTTYEGQSREIRSVALPAGLPAPVERFYRTTMDDSVPVVTSAVVTGRGHLRIGPVRFPARWRFTHEAGQGYRHYIEATIFGRPLMRVNEHYLDGHARFQLPMGVTENEPKLDMSANLALWGEAIFFPSIYLTDGRVRWEPIDATHARLIVPFGSDQDSFIVSFDPDSGLMKSIEALRWKEVTSATKTLWRVNVGAWKQSSGILLPTEFSILWEGDTGPWYTATVEHIVYNADVSSYIKAMGE